MNKIKLGGIMLLAAMVATSCSDYPHVKKNHFLIEGEITNVPDSVEVQLIRNFGMSATTIQTDLIIDGKFSLTDTLSQGVEFMRIDIDYNHEDYRGGSLAVAVAPRSYTKVTGDGMAHAKWHAEGSLKEQEVMNDYRVAVAEIEGRYIDAQGEMMRLIKEYMRLVNSKDPEEKKLSQKAFNKYRTHNNKVLEPIDNELSIATAEYMLTIPVDEYWLYKFRSEFVPLLRYEQYDDIKPYITEMYEYIPQRHFRKGVGATIYTLVNMPEDVEVGDDMVDGELYDMEGNKHTLSEIKSDYILLDFWGLGCGPCMMSIPEMEGIIDFYGDELTVVGISTSGDSKGVRNLIKEKNLGGMQLYERSDPKILFERYGDGGVPHYVLISPERKVIDIMSGYASGYLNEMVSEHLGRRDQLLGIPECGEVIRLDPNFKLK